MTNKFFKSLVIFFSVFLIKTLESAENTIQTKSRQEQSCEVAPKPKTKAEQEIEKEAKSLINEAKAIENKKEKPAGWFDRIKAHLNRWGKAYGIGTGITILIAMIAGKKVYDANRRADDAKAETLSAINRNTEINNRALAADAAAQKINQDAMQARARAVQAEKELANYKAALTEELDDLYQDNDKDWFDTYKDEYEAEPSEARKLKVQIVKELVTKKGIDTSTPDWNID